MARMKNFIDQTYDNQNVYLIINDNKEGIMIDASNAAAPAVRYLNDNKINLKAIFIGHGHIDHFEGLDHVLRAFPNVKIYIQKTDLKLLAQKKVDDVTGKLLEPAVSEPVNNLVELEGDAVVNEIGYEIEVFHAPGHTSGTQFLRFKKIMLLTFGYSLLPDKASPGYTGSMCNDQYFLDFLKKMTDLDPQWFVLPGHNAPFLMKDVIDKKLI